MEQMIQEKRKELTNQLRVVTRIVHRGNHLTSNRKKLNIDDIYVILSSVSALRRYDGKLLLYDLETGLYNEPRLVIRQYLIIIFREVDDTYTMTMINKLITYLYDKQDEAIPTLISPPKQTYLFKNGWFNIETGENVGLMNDNNEEYARLNIRPYRYLSLDEIDERHLNLAKQRLNEWSSYNNDKLTQLKQVLYSVIQGQHRKRIIIVEGDDDSKSTFMNVAKSLVGDNQVARVNLNEFNNNTILNAIKPRTMLISGIELPQDTRLSPTTKQRLNLFLSNESITIKVKYQTEPKQIQSSAVIVQVTNQLPKSFKDDPDIHNKLLVISLPSLNNESLDDLPIEAIANYILSTTDDFTDYHVLNQPSIAHFIAYLSDLGAFNMTWFIPSLMYQVYLNWLKTTNIATKPMTQKKFSSQILKQARKENLLNDKYEPTTKRLKHLMLNDNDLATFLDKHNIAINVEMLVRVYQTTYHN